VASPVLSTPSSISLSAAAISDGLRTDGRMIVLVGIKERELSQRFEFDPSSGEFKETVHKDYEEAAAGARGFADLRTIGIRHHSEIFTAVYSLDGALHVSIPPQHFAWPGPYVARRRSRLGRIKSFSITEGPRQYLQFFYAFVDSSHEFPGPEVVDIFYLIAHETSSEERLRSFIYFWEASAAGEDVTNSTFQQRLSRVSKGAPASV
jgi:hypothetical protein